MGFFSKKTVLALVVLLLLPAVPSPRRRKP